MTSIAVAVACILIGGCCYFFRALTQSKSQAFPQGGNGTTECEDYYDAENIGVREVISGRLHVFPLSLVQQIDARSDTSGETEDVTFYVTAEFNYAEFRLSESSAERFLLVIEGALPAFEMAEVKAKVANVFSSGEGATIYVSPNYPDAGIFPKFRTAR